MRHDARDAESRARGAPAPGAAHRTDERRGAAQLLPQCHRSSALAPACLCAWPHCAGARRPARKGLVPPGGAPFSPSVTLVSNSFLHRIFDVRGLTACPLLPADLCGKNLCLLRRCAVCCPCVTTFVWALTCDTPGLRALKLWQELVLPEITDCALVVGLCHCQAH